MAHHAIPKWSSRVSRVDGVCFCTRVFWYWVLAHECGHQAFSRWRLLNDSVGFVLHSFLLVPYFSFKITHGKHHKATTGHMLKDLVLVPKTLSTLIIRRGGLPSEDPLTEQLYDLIEEVPIVSLYVFIIQYPLGWFRYLLLNMTGQKCPDRSRWSINHFNPTSPLFTPSKYNKILLSDLGVVLAVISLVFACRTRCFLNVVRYYLLLYFSVNYWLVMITYLQHTDPALPHYLGEAWNFQRGAAAHDGSRFRFHR